MTMNTSLLSVILITLSFSTHASEPIYKCTGEVSGGFQQEKEGPSLGRFYNSDYRIVPFSKIPDEAVEKLIFNTSLRNENFNSFHIRRGSSREETKEAYLSFANSLTYKNRDGTTIETEGLLFFRNSEDDPKDGFSYVDCKHYISKPYSWVDITCNNRFGSALGEVFLYSNGNFVHARLSPRRMKEANRRYYGDSSILTFGTCKKYYD